MKHFLLLGKLLMAHKLKPFQASMHMINPWVSNSKYELADFMHMIMVAFILSL